MSHNLLTIAFAPKPPIYLSRSNVPMESVEIHKLYADRNLIQEICHLIKECIFEIECYSRNMRRENIYISMPEYFYIILERYMVEQTYMSPSRPATDHRRFEGVEILPHYYNEIVIFHKYAVDAGIDPFIISLDFKQINEP